MGRWLILGLVLLLPLATCVPGSGEEDKDLTYAGPTEIGIGKGEFLPGTDIQYLGKTEEGAQLLIGGQQALKKIGDSLNWVYNPLDGVAVNLKLRVLLITEEKLHLLGTARITVLDPSPRPAAIDTSAPIRYKIPVDYHIKKGQTIPGTVILYLGETEQGAELGGIEGYPYREMGDSIVWKGQLYQSNGGRVWLELNLRTVVISQESLNAAGTAALWIAP